MTYFNQLSTAMKSEFENKYGLKTRMTVAKYKKQAKMVKYLERSCPITVLKPSYVIRMIDPINCDGQWSWNDSTVVGSFHEDEEILGDNRKLLKWARDNDYLNESSKGKVSVVDHGDMVEIVQKSNGMPIMAIVNND